MICENYQAEISKIKKEAKFTIALAGNPNVGKSTIFNQLTGLGAVTANYPGKTVALNFGLADYQGTPFGVVDLPGIYSLGSISEDQLVARREILEGRADVVVVIIDATNLERNLYLALQLIDLQYPLVIACNLMDIAAKHKICLDTEKLSALLGVPVIPVTAVTGEGINELIKTCQQVANKELVTAPKLPEYGKDISGKIENLSASISQQLKSLPYGLSPRALALLLLEEDEEFTSLVEKTAGGPAVLHQARAIFAEIEKSHGERAAIRLARERHGYEGFLTDQVQKVGVCPIPLSTRLWRQTLSPLTGLPILLAGLIGVFAIMFYFGNFLAVSFDSFWAAFISPYIKLAVFSLLGQNPFSSTLLWGVDAGFQAALSVGIPYILTFYLLLAFLEDTGYLNSIAFLTDAFMHKVGLHGRSIIPLIAGAGCNVPAIIGTRVLTTWREKVTACTLITLVPCSARTAVIMGAVAFFIGWQWALLIYLIDLIIGIIVGRLMAVFLPGESSGLVMEMFPFRRPKLSTIIKKTWYRLKDFLVIALPLIAIGSLLLGALYETKLMWLFTVPLSPIIETWLGLPPVAGICLLFGLLRKELALQLLLALAIIAYGPNIHNLLSFMNKEQIFVFALVTTLYIPCIATVSALIKELGWKITAAIGAFSIALAILVGGLAHHALLLLKVL